MQNQLTEKDMLQDSIMTEKHVSSAYNTAIIESVNQQIMQTLQHIQLEEQNHAQLFFEAMHKKGWYDVESVHPNQAAKQEISQQIANQMQGRIQSLAQNQEQ
jgi:spore coat protein CotF